VTQPSFGPLGQTIGGIAVSIVFFLITYRQTFGARKERAKAATKSLVSALSRRLVLEEFRPSIADIERLIDGRALEHDVRAADLLRPTQLMAMVYSQVFDSDLITPEKRAKVETLIVETLADNTGRNSVTVPQTPRTSYSVLLTVGLGVLTIGVGGAIMIAIPAAQKTRVDPRLFMIGLGVSSLIIGAIIWVRLARESGEGLVDFFSSQDMNSSLPRKIERTLRQAKCLFDRDVEIGTGLADYIVDTSKGKVLLHVLPARLAPEVTLTQTRLRAQRMKDASAATESIVVVPDGQVIPDELSVGDVRVMTVTALCGHIASIGPRLPVKTSAADGAPKH